METNPSTPTSRFNVHPTATIIKEHFAGGDPDKDFVFERRRPSNLFGPFTVKSSQTIQNHYLQELKGPIKNFLKRKFTVSHQPGFIVNPSRIRAMLLQAEAIKATSDRPNLKDLRIESIVREFFVHKEVWPQPELGINPRTIPHIKQRLKQQKLSDNDKQVLKDAAFILQNKLALTFIIKERTHNRVALFDAAKQLTNINDIFPGKNKPTARISFISCFLYTGYIGANNDIAYCGELTGYALYKNYILSNKKINTIPILCHISFHNYTALPDQIRVFDNHACIILMDINEFIEQKDKNKFSDRLRCCIDQDALLPPVFTNVTAVIADPWLKISEVITPSSWAVYLKKMAKECGLQPFESYSLKFKLLYE